MHISYSSYLPLLFVTCLGVPTLIPTLHVPAPSLHVLDLEDNKVVKVKVSRHLPQLVITVQLGLYMGSCYVIYKQTGSTRSAQNSCKEDE